VKTTQAGWVGAFLPGTPCETQIYHVTLSFFRTALTLLRMFLLPRSVIVVTVGVAVFSAGILISRHCVNTEWGKNTEVGKTGEVKYRVSGRAKREEGCANTSEVRVWADSVVNPTRYVVVKNSSRRVLARAELNLKIRWLSGSRSGTAIE